MRQTFPAGTICLRCGTEKKERDKPPCSHWGKSWPRHLWNSKPVTMQVEYVNQSGRNTEPTGEEEGQEMLILGMHIGDQTDIHLEDGQVITVQLREIRKGPNGAGCVRLGYTTYESVCVDDVADLDLHDGRSIAIKVCEIREQRNRELCVRLGYEADKSIQILRRDAIVKTPKDR